jgi:hypothetical protein
MQTIKSIFEETLDLDEGYKVGENIAFKVVDGADDTGVITAVSGDTYSIKSNLTGKIVKGVKAEYVMDAGAGSGADAAADAIADGQVSA